MVAQPDLNTATRNWRLLRPDDGTAEIQRRPRETTLRVLQCKMVSLNNNGPAGYRPQDPNALGSTITPGHEKLRQRQRMTRLLVAVA
jgi:hypothetical protein